MGSFGEPDDHVRSAVNDTAATCKSASYESKTVAAMAQRHDELRQGSQTSIPADASMGALDRRCLRIFHEAELAAAHASANRLGEAEAVAFMARLWAAGSSRPLIPPVPTWEANLEWLSHVFPKFEEVVESSIRPSLRTAAQGGLPRPTPLLVTGAAEQEMVAFAGAVARALDVPFFQFDVAAATDSTCNRSSTTFTTLAFGTESHIAVANPVGLANLGRLRTRSEVQSAEHLATLLDIDDGQRAQDPFAQGIHFDASPHPVVPLLPRHRPGSS